MKEDLADFFFTFQGIKGCSTATAAAATMIHATAANQGLNLQVRQSLIAGIDLTSGEKEVVASSAAATSKLPARHLLYGQLEKLSNDEWTGLLHIAVAITCYDPNKEQQFERARTALVTASLGNFKKPSEALAHISKLLQDANTAFGQECMT